MCLVDCHCSTIVFRRSGRRVQAPDPPSRCRRARLRTRRAARFPPHSNGVGSRFHPRTVASSHAMISPGVCGCCPARARRTRMRWIDSAIVSQEPPSGVYSGMIPCRNSHSTSSGVVCPARLSQMSSMRKGGNSTGKVGRIVKPACHTSHCARLAALGVRSMGGSAATIAVNSACSHGCNTKSE